MKKRILFIVLTCLVACAEDKLEVNVRNHTKSDFESIVCDSYWRMNIDQIINKDGSITSVKESDVVGLGSNYLHVTTDSITFLWLGIDAYGNGVCTMESYKYVYDEKTGIVSDTDGNALCTMLNIDAENTKISVFINYSKNYWQYRLSALSADEVSLLLNEVSLRLENID